MPALCSLVVRRATPPGRAVKLLRGEDLLDWAFYGAAQGRLPIWGGNANLLTFSPLEQSVFWRNDHKNDLECTNSEREVRVVGKLASGVRGKHARHRQRFERGADHLRRAQTIGVVSGLRLEQFGVGQDDTELIVQAMEESGKIAEVSVRRAIFSHCPLEGECVDVIGCVTWPTATRRSSVTICGARLAAAKASP